MAEIIDREHSGPLEFVVHRCGKNSYGFVAKRNGVAFATDVGFPNAADAMKAAHEEANKDSAMWDTHNVETGNFWQPIP
jgi:hypothetical protein